MRKPLTIEDIKEVEKQFASWPIDNSPKIIYVATQEQYYFFKERGLEVRFYDSFINLKPCS